MHADLTRKTARIAETPARPQICNARDYRMISGSFLAFSAWYVESDKDNIYKHSAVWAFSITYNEI